MERDDFLKALNESASQFKKAFTQKGGPWLSAMCAGKDFEDGRKPLCIDYVYELMCCFSIVGDLKPNVENLRLIQGAGANGFRFPAKPGAKSYFAFFRFEKNGKTFDLCCGTQITAPGNEPPECPDVSLQEMGPSSSTSDNHRDCGRPVRIWDAKYHGSRATKADRDQMSAWCDILEIPKCDPGDSCSQILPDHFAVSAVITNVKPKRFNRTQSLRRHFSFLFEFKGLPGPYSLAPTHAEHKAAG